MSLEGRLRDLDLAAVLQLLALGRKTGTLHLRAPLSGRAARVVCVQGAIVSASDWADTPESVPPPPPAADARLVERIVLALLLWRDGQFHFVASESGAGHDGTVRLSVEPLLMEGARRAEVWSRIEGRIPHASVIPDFVEVEPQQLPLLRLEPSQWEILTGVDGQRDLTTLAESLGRDLLDVAEAVHGLLVAGVLTIRDRRGVNRRNATPPAQQAIDPVRRSLPSVSDAGIVTTRARDGVASAGADPSLQQTSAARAAVGTVIRPPSGELCALGDEAARRGDLHGAVGYWERALLGADDGRQADRVRGKLHHAARLRELLEH